MDKIINRKNNTGFFNEPSLESKLNNIDQDLLDTITKGMKYNTGTEDSSCGPDARVWVRIGWEKKI